MHIGLFLADCDGGGAQRTMVNLAHAFDGLAQNVTVFVGRGDGPAAEWLAQRPVETVALGERRLRSLIGPLRTALSRTRPDVLLSTMLDANIVAWMARAMVMAPPGLVLRETNSQRARTDLGRVRRILAARAYRGADRVVALSGGVGRELIEDCRLDPSRVATIHNPVDIGDMPKGGRPAAMPDGRVVISAGRFARQKNYPLLIRAFADLPQDCQLVLLGQGPDEAALRGLAEELGVGDRVFFPGFVRRPVDWFAHANVFALSSAWEGFGHVIVEAMAVGCPVVATDCPHGPRDIIDDGKTGLLAPVNDVAALAKAMRRILEDTDMANRFAIAGKARALDFAPRRIAMQYLDLFEAMRG